MLDLPEDMLEEIFRFLESRWDLITCGQVCRSWRRIVQRVSNCQPQSPFLLVSGNGFITYIIDICTRKQEVLARPLEIFCCSKQWAFARPTTDEETNQWFLFDPISKTDIPLPAIDHLHRATISDSPAMGLDCFVGIIHGNERSLSSCIVGEEVWNDLSALGSGFMDLIFYENEIYASDGGGKVFCFGAPFHPQLVRVIQSPINSQPEGPLIDSTSKNRLVQSAVGDFFMVISASINSQAQFLIFKLKAEKWDRLINLENAAFFIGNDEALYVPDARGVSKGCLYVIARGGMRCYSPDTHCANMLYESDNAQFNWL